ncbi:MAG: TraV family lipoprotein [Deltaproteobacteria bacterium]|jgi:conjugal transfer pilus assembly protein TraV|nr:TraV family lipoprotein [Deltaproteobacteria bacterium]MBT4525322.1 TraV family lipoprotein [Deltaproteobacteria bacterium]
MRSNLKNTITLFILITLTSCTEAMNPFNEEFTCNRGDNNGECINITEAYHKSFNDSGKKTSQGKNKYKKTKYYEKVLVVKRNPAPYSSMGRKNIYTLEYVPYFKKISTVEKPANKVLKDQEYNELTGIIKAPITPLIKQPKVMQMLITPSKSENGKVLSMERTIFIILEDPEFMLGNIYD